MKLFKNYITRTIALGIVAFALINCSEDDGPGLGAIPAADFNASATSVEQGTTVTFTDVSTNSPSLWTWNFEGGSPTYSNKPNPEVYYVVKGTWGVTMTCRNAAGADEITKTGFIDVSAPPVVDIDKVPLVKLDFETTLDNVGSVGTAATSSGGTNYELRTLPGGFGFIFDGTTNPLTIPGFTGINGAGSRSVACWIKTTANTANTGIVHWGASGSFSRSSFKYNKTGTIRFEYQGGGHNGATIVNDGEWHHIAYTYDGSTIKLYVDAVEDFTISGKTLRTGEAGETDVNIGSQGTGAKFQGSLDDVRIYDVVLTPEEIVTLSEIK
ncbi:MAG: PKD domain-containing protein [Bacteroidetes bacterium]|nr:PKD domain-containing protein [Bacteroidota bacterium]